jgi:hypothetical protein
METTRIPGLWTCKNWEEMRHLKTILILMAICFVISYLGGSFYSWSFNAGQWAAKVRENTIGWWFGTFVLSLFIYMLIEANKSNRS